MELAKSCDYAVRGLLYLAQRPDPFEPVLLRDVAREARAPEAFMSKVFQGLRACRIVRSHRGRARGYSLARPASEISLYDVILAMQGQAALSSIPPPANHEHPRQAFQQAWWRIEQQIVESLKRHTLETLLSTVVESSA